MSGCGSREKELREKVGFSQSSQDYAIKKFSNMTKQKPLYFQFLQMEYRRIIQFWDFKQYFTENPVLAQNSIFLQEIMVDKIMSKLLHCIPEFILIFQELKENLYSLSIQNSKYTHLIVNNKVSLHYQFQLLQKDKNKDQNNLVQVQEVVDMNIIEFGQMVNNYKQVDLWKKTKKFKVVQYYYQKYISFKLIPFLFEDHISPLISSRLKDSTYLQIKLTPNLLISLLRIHNLSAFIIENRYSYQHLIT
ncbi:unnamed protein product [Paramecium primaurelia]|uniref:Uncharacterized protein n=1 Tax=Paramecium primaurelia TaxID=5886 RepID=A0A8S1L8F4_PARPR|nr:unnamed protein product [Paramecium primaurelia]